MVVEFDVIQHQVQEGDMVVTGHAGHLLQAVLNLIENAEHALAATRSGQIAVSVARTDDAVVPARQIRASSAGAVFMDEKRSRTAR